MLSKSFQIIKIFGNFDLGKGSPKDTNKIIKSLISKNATGPDKIPFPFPPNLVAQIKASVDIIHKRTKNTQNLKHKTLFRTDCFMLLKSGCSKLAT